MSSISALRPPVEHYARQIHQQLGLDQFPIDPKEVIRSLKFGYRETSFNGIEKLQGCLARRPGKPPVIYVRDSISYMGRKRFTAAHELGHAQIPWHQDIDYRCTAYDINAYQSYRTQEKEANEFASELLMPQRHLEQDLKQGNFGVELVSEIAEKYGLSLSAAAVRVVKSFKAPCAIVFSQDGEIKWSISSPAFRTRFSVKTGGRVHELSYANDLYEGKDQHLPEDVLGFVWLDGRIPRELFLREHSIGMPTLRAVITYLSLPEPIQDDNEDDFAEDDF